MSAEGTDAMLMPLSGPLQGATHLLDDAARRLKGSGAFGGPRLATAGGPSQLSTRPRPGSHGEEPLVPNRFAMSSADDASRGGYRIDSGPLPKTGKDSPLEATSTHYKWRNKRMPDGNHISATLEDGVLTVTVRAKGLKGDRLRRPGWLLLDDVFEHFGIHNIEKFKATWVNNPRFSDNYDEFVENLMFMRMSLPEAARNTWTGRQLTSRGFNGRVSMKKIEPPPWDGFEGFEVTFEKRFR